MKTSTNELLKVFIDNAIIEGECTEKGDHKKGNKAFDIIAKVAKKIKQLDPKFNVLLPLLKHKNDSVKLHAAFYLLPYQIKLAERVLKKISKNNGLVAFTAEMTLKEWKAGRLKFN